MLTVYKYNISMEKDNFSIDMPKNAKILTVQEQHGDAQMWALVNPNAKIETRNFRVAGTGHPINEGLNSLEYLGTFQFHNGDFIGHVFEIK